MGAGYAGMGEREGGPRIPLLILVSGPSNHHIIVVVRGRLMGVSLSDSHTSVCVVCSARHRLGTAAALRNDAAGRMAVCACTGLARTAEKVAQ